MIISNCMKRIVHSISPATTIRQAAETFVSYHIGTLPVVDADGKLVGILQIRDLVSLVMPDFVNLMQDFDFVIDFGAAEFRKPDHELLVTPISAVMQPPISVEGDSGLLRASALFKKHHLSDLPVVDENERLIGIASLVDIGTAFLARWEENG
jgi:CBS domain-containing protein